MKNFDVFAIFVVARVASVFAVQTFFVPDEYWQSLEVAHKVVFGYGYLSWEWLIGIRSYVYPMIFAALYKLLEIIKADNALCVIYGPRILQALLSAYSDLCFYRWSGSRKWAVFSILTSWFWFYTASRTLINTFECALTTIALSKFPWPYKTQGGSSSFLWVVALLCMVRPTAAIIWTPICLYHLGTSRQGYMSLILNNYLPIGLTVFTLSVLIDSYSHTSFVITSYEFLKYNIFHDVGSWYGSQPWHWYLSSGFPALLGIQLVPFVLSTLVVIKNRSIHPNELLLLATIIHTIVMYSFLPHKEFRFLLPLLPIVLYISSRFLAAWSCKASRFTLWLVASVMFVGNLFPMFYFSFLHQRGTIDVMTPLREIAENNPSNTDLLFLMPCHSTPFYSHLHVNVSARFLTCEPDFTSAKFNYMDEADQFYSNPSVWLRKHYTPNSTLPSHIITYDTLVPHITDILSRYKMTHQLFHTSFPTPRIGQYVLIHERIDFS